MKKRFTMVGSDVNRQLVHMYDEVFYASEGDMRLGQVVNITLVGHTDRRNLFVYTIKTLKGRIVHRPAVVRVDTGE